MGKVCHKRGYDLLWGVGQWVCMGQRTGHRGISPAWNTYAGGTQKFHRTAPQTPTTERLIRKAISDAERNHNRLIKSGFWAIFIQNISGT
jgi:hypothetical protein